MHDQLAHARRRSPAPPAGTREGARARRGSGLCSISSSGRPSTYSSARYGRPPAVTPASYSLAMCGCARAARMSRSRAIRSMSPARGHAPRGSFNATWRRTIPSVRSASQTVPMPPSPSSRSSRYGPTVAPARSRFVCASIAPTSTRGTPLEKIDRLTDDSWRGAPAAAASARHLRARTRQAIRARSSGGQIERLIEQAIEPDPGFGVHWLSVGTQFYCAALLQRLAKEQPCLLPIPAHRAARDAQGLRNLDLRHPAEVPHFHDLSHARVERSQLVERVVHPQNLTFTARGASPDLRCQRDLGSSLPPRRSACRCRAKSTMTERITRPVHRMKCTRSVSRRRFRRDKTEVRFVHER